jgi:hypothetical protein
LGCVAAFSSAELCAPGAACADEANATAIAIATIAAKLRHAQSFRIDLPWLVTLSYKTTGAYL